MGHGLGTTQRAILAAVAETPRGLTSAEIADSIGRSQVQVRNATDALRARGHVSIRRECIGRRKDGMPLFGRRISLASKRGKLIAISGPDAVAFIEKWHYSGTASAGVARYGWEIDGELVGVSIYNTGSHDMRAGPFGPDHYRHVLHHHRLAIHPDAPKLTASAFLGACLRQLHHDRADLWAVVTYADLCQGHDGIIYRATNALPCGVVGKGNLKFRDREGNLRVTQSMRGTWPERRQKAALQGWTEVRCKGKARYVWVIGSARFKARLRAELRWLQAD